MRMGDYQSIGYEVVWLLDDKRYNKRMARPAEECVRKFSAYYLMIEKGLTSRCYDQFEIFESGKRVKRGKRMGIDLQKVRKRPKMGLSEEFFPKQITQLKNIKYFVGDRTDRALRNHHLTMHYWKTLENEFGKAKKRANRFIEWLKKNLLVPYETALKRMIKKMR